MKVYAGMDPRMPLQTAAEHARRVERLGYDGLHVAETVHDSLAVSLLALEHTTHLRVRTAVTLAFVRSPTLLAYSSWDLQAFSGGRFELGLGTQVRQNIEDRYSMPWSEPVARMADCISTLQDLFEAFASGGRVDHRGPHYRVTRLQPYFNPGPDPDVEAPPIWLGGVNAGICELAGRVADGFVTHPTNSNPRYLAEICRPALASGAESAGRSLTDIELVVGTQVVTGADAAARDAERERQRRLFAFLYSTPAYRRTLELYGWDDLASRLQALIRSEKWDDLPAVVTDEVLDTLVPSATVEELPDLLLERFGKLGDGVLLSVPEDPAVDERLAAAIRRLQTA